MNAQRKALHLLIPVLFAIPLYGQEMAVRGTSYQKLKQQVLHAQADSIDWSEALSLNDIEALFKKGDSFHTDLPVSILEQQANQQKGDWGIRANSSFHHYFREVIDVSTNNAVRSSASVGLSWNILNDGLLENRLKSKQTNYQKHLEELAHSTSNKQRAYGPLFDYINFLANCYKRPLLEQRVALLECHIQVAKELFWEREIGRTELEEVRQQLRETNIALATCQDFIEGFNLTYESVKWPVKKQRFPLVKLDLDTIMALDSIRMTQSEAVLRNSIELQHSIANLPTLNINSNYHARVGQTNNEFFPSISVGLQVPIQRKASDRALEQLELKQMTDDVRMAQQSQHKELLNLYYTYQYKYKTYTANLSVIRITQDEMRRNQLLSEAYFNSEQTLLSINLLHRRQEIALNQIDLLKDMYQIILAIYVKNDSKSPVDFIKKPANNKATPQIWMVMNPNPGDTAELYFKLEYLAHNGFDHIILQGDNSTWYNHVLTELLQLSYTVKTAIPAQTSSTTFIDANAYPTKTSLFLDIEKSQGKAANIVLHSLKSILHLEQITLTQFAQP